MAWGLHGLHELGLVHQDVKPANVLLTTDGVAKVADFGLARARGTGSAASGESGVVIRAGLTPAYATPEQLGGPGPRPSQTDVWSWGVSVLEMFTGEATWRIGAVAPFALDEYLGSEETRAGRPRMPPAVAEVLRACFREGPGDRVPILAARRTP